MTPSQKPQDGDPRAVSDDAPSSIVQQMPVGDLAELRSSIPAGPWTAHSSHPLNACTYVCAGVWNREVATLYGCFDDVKQPDEGQPWPDHPIREATARAIAMLPDLLDEVIAHRARRATEADLRAEVERLTARMTNAAQDVLAERQRQISAEGWTPEHDDQHDDGELAAAGATYALSAANCFVEQPFYRVWPWRRAWWKPTTPRRDLVKAGALILAEIERLDRAALSPETDGGQDG